MNTMKKPLKSPVKAKAVATKKAASKSVTKSRRSPPSALKKRLAVPSVKSKASGGKRILVVDDEADIRSTVKTVLEKSGYRVETAQNGDECIEKTKTGKYDLILLDIMMPGTPVKDVINHITTIPIAFLSVVRTSDEEKRILLQQPNIKAFIAKPFEIQELIAQVKKLT